MYEKDRQIELQNLRDIKENLKNAIEKIDEHLEQYRNEIQQQKDYLWKTKLGWITWKKYLSGNQ